MARLFLYRKEPFDSRKEYYTVVKKKFLKEKYEIAKVTIVPKHSYEIEAIQEISPKEMDLILGEILKIAEIDVSGAY